MSSTNHARRRKEDNKVIHQFRSLQLLNAYRFIISGLLFSFNFVEITFIGRVQLGKLFFIISSFYLAFSLISFFISSNKLLSQGKQVHINVLVDVISIALFTLMSGGISSGWGTLILAPIAGASLLLPGQSALLFASYGAVALIVQEFYGDISGLINDTSYSQTGLIGIALFATAFLAITLARRVSESVALAEKRGIDLANLSQLNDHIINRIESGIIVIDEDNSIKLMNRAASSLLCVDDSQRRTTLQQLSPALHHAHQIWISAVDNEFKTKPYEIPRANQLALRARITKVGSRVEDRGSVIYLSDTSELNRHIQESKLASLGRLTASIAHEIRNPLGAISHAAQLLDESDTLSPDNKRLADIIHDQTTRLNKIIESVLRLSRKQSANVDLIPLQEWLLSFLKEFNEFNKLTNNWVSLDCQNPQLLVYGDPDYLHQILWNLCTNALKYARSDNTQPTVTLRGYNDSINNTCYLDIIDDGPGIAEPEQDKLFEPFYTTSSSGTGLGLYISRELCLSAGGDLTYSNTPDSGSCFKIRFAKHNQI